jgi:hypothetical protein
MTDSKLTELERRVTGILRYDAQLAMRSTDTERQYHDFLASTESSAHRRRLTWGISAVAASVVVIALVMAGLLAGSSGEAANVVPATPVGERTPVQIATDFIDALATYDVERASLVVSPLDEDNLKIWPGEPSVADSMAWAEAIRFRLLARLCVDNGTGPDGEVAVDCRIDFDMLGSDSLGRGPYSEVITFLIEGEQIVGASGLNWYIFGLTTDPRTDGFVTWLKREHPDVVPDLLERFGQGQGAQYRPVWTDDSYALWAKYVDQWVESQQ